MVNWGRDNLKFTIMKKSTIIYILIALIVVVGGVALYIYLKNGDDGSSGDSSNNGGNVPSDNDGIKDDGRDYATYKSVEKDGFKLEYKYVGESTWDYRITGSLPNPCYDVKVDSLVRESYPEQVVFNLTVVGPKKDVVCAQVIKEYSYRGVFNASEKASVEMNVVN